jgi:adenine phosphoribosyltransferase
MVTPTSSLKDHIRDIPDFPVPGVVFRDITPLLAVGPAFRSIGDAFTEHYGDAAVDVVIGIEARGFIVAAPVADRLGAGFVPVRKAGKLPWRIERQEYDLEYGTDRLEVHLDAIRPGQRALIVDDVLATGGTARATAQLVERLGGVVIGFAFVIELGFLGGRERIEGHPVLSLVTYE